MGTAGPLALANEILNDGSGDPFFVLNRHGPLFTILTPLLHHAFNAREEDASCLRSESAGNKMPCADHPSHCPRPGLVSAWGQQSRGQQRSARKQQ